MIISFDSPTFFAGADEDHFFQWLYALPGHRTIRGVGTTLELTLDDPVERDTVEQLLVIFRRWCVDVTPLLPLRSPGTTHLTLWDNSLAASQFGSNGVG